jgi:hypothetical protein
MTAIPSNKKAELPKIDKEIKINNFFKFFMFNPYYKLDNLNKKGNEVYTFDEKNSYFF